MTGNQVLKPFTLDDLYGGKGSWWDPQRWKPQIGNIYTGKRLTKAHHCGTCEAKLTRKCFVEYHYAYCSAFIRKLDGTWARCGQVFWVTSPGCGLHPYEELYNLGLRNKRKGDSLDPDEFQNETLLAEMAEANAKAEPTENIDEIRKDLNDRVDMTYDEEEDPEEAAKAVQDKYEYKFFNKRKQTQTWAAQDKVKAQRAAARQEATMQEEKLQKERQANNQLDATAHMKLTKKRNIRIQKAREQEQEKKAQREALVEATNQDNKRRGNTRKRG